MCEQRVKTSVSHRVLQVVTKTHLQIKIWCQDGARWSLILGGQVDLLVPNSHQFIFSPSVRLRGRRPGTM